MDRRARLLGELPVASRVGLEIGALHAPMVRRTEGRVQYVDYAPTEVLRANFQYAEVDPACIVDVDIVWGERALRDCVAELVDYVLASHVIEHVPDLIGWLLELHAVLKPGGILGLAIPDRRNTFDVRRNVSTHGEMVEAYLRQYRQPSLRQVFDAASLSKNSTGVEDWRAGESLAGLPDEVRERLPLALNLVQELARTQRYNDAHCWIFTPESFLEMAEGLSAMGYFPYTIEAFFPSEPGSIEFQVRLKSIEDSADPTILDSIRAARRTFDPGTDTQPAATIEPGLADEISRLALALAQLEQNNSQLLSENTALHKSIATIRESTSWRATAPLRFLMERLRSA